MQKSMGMTAVATAATAAALQEGPPAHPLDGIPQATKTRFEVAGRH